jgi:hypothetical protein
LVVLSIDPSLWNKLNGGDDNILFRADDYKEPYKSTAFAALKSHGDHRVRELALLLESLCYVRSITDVQEFAADRLFVLLQQMPAGGVAVVGGANSSSIPSWLGRSSDIDNQLDPKESPGSWIVDHIRFDQKTFEAPLLRYRLGIVGLPLSVLLVLGLSAFVQTNSVLFIAGPSGIFAGIMLFLRNGFSNDPMNKTKLEVRSARSLALREVTRMKHNIPPKEKQIEKQRAEFETHLASIKTSSLKTVKQVAETKKKPSDEFSSRKQQAHSKRQTIDSADADECSVITTKYTGQVNMLRNQLSTLDQGLQAQLASNLKTFQDEFVQNYLKGFSLNQAGISGIGEKLKERLTRCGIRTAADATHYAVLRVEGIGYQKAAAIKRWTDGILQRARNSIPTRLDLTRETQARQIRNDVEQQKRVIQTKVADLERRRDADINASRQRFQQQRYELDKGILLAEAEYQKMMADADAAGARENAKWAQQANDATRTFNSWIADAETDLLTVRGELAKREYEYSLVERKLAAYRGITFVRWLRHQLVGG